MKASYSSVESPSKYNLRHTLLTFDGVTTPQKRVVIAPLAWGLGHATRCIPVVEELLKMKHEVFAVLTPSQQAVFEKHFGKRIGYVTFNEQPIHYRYSFAVAMVIQLRRFVRQIKQEERLAEQLVEQLKPDLLISDNRYGFRHTSVRSIFIGHQLQLRAGLLSGIATKINHTLIQRFDRLWIPDNENDPRLAGKLAHGKKPNRPITYVGWLSRLKPTKATTPRYDVLFLLSGPEPQRTALEEILLECLTLEKLKIIALRGLPESEELPGEMNHVKWMNHASASETAKIIAESRVVICRSGYSSLMDLAAVGRKALLIPTPGQTEQEYLARYFRDKFGFETARQNQPEAIRKTLIACLEKDNSWDIAPQNRLKAAIESALND